MMEVFVVDDEKRVYEILRKNFPQHSFSYFPDGPSVFKALREKTPDIIFVDLNFEKTPPPKLISRSLPEKEGLFICDKIKSSFPSLKVYLISRFGDVNVLDYAAQKGIEFIDSGWGRENLVTKLREVLEGKKDRLEEIQEKLKEAGFYTKNKEILSQVADLDLSPENRERVLIIGETGTGKNTLALALHRIINPPSSPFIRVHLPGMPESLFESELFGYERGAFTGAERNKKGKIELAKGGTLFLDEIGFVEREVQAKLLEVLESSTFYRIGAKNPIPIEAKIVGATMSPRVLDALKFRFQKIVELPPLRKRREDIEYLIEIYETKGLNFTEAAKRALKEELDFPGNVRMLIFLLEKMLKKKDGSLDYLYELYFKSKDNTKNSSTHKLSVKEIVEYLIQEKKNFKKLEDEIFIYLIQIGESADTIMKILGIKKSTYYLKRKKLGEN